MRQAWACALASVALGLPAWAADVSLEQARTSVGNWLRADGRPLGSTLGAAVGAGRTYAGTNGAALFHVVRLDPAGFVVTSADDGVLPVIAFSGAADLVADERNPLWVLLNRDLPRRRAAAAQAAGPPVRAVTTLSESTVTHRALWKALLSTEAEAPVVATGLSSVSDPRVSPLVQSRWSQSDVAGLATYNYYTPNNYVCGCVATAGAQLMRFHEHPSAAVSAGAYTCFVNGIATVLTMKGGTYAWSDMPLTPSSSISLVQRQSIGKLTYDVGVACYMQYSAAASGALDSNLAAAFSGRFGYADAHVLLDQASGVDGHLPRAALANLDAGYPVVLGIRGAAGGHEVLGDGYGYSSGRLYIHLNMGWAGNEDAWYNLPSVDSSPSFSLLGSIVFNVFPAHGGELLTGRVLDGSGAPVGGASVVALNETTGVELPAVLSNARGLYAVKAPSPVYPATHQYRVTATSGALTGSASTELAASRSTTTTFNPDTGAGGYSPGSGQAGNRWGVDIHVVAGRPEMDVQGNARSIADGDTTPGTADHTDFGAADVSGGTVSRTFTIRNSGAGALNLSGSPRVTVSGTHAADFTVTATPGTPVPAGGSTAFTVRFDPAAAGTRTAALSIANDDDNENPYNFSIRGTGVSTAPEVDVQGNGTSIVDGDMTPTTADGTDFGAAPMAGGTVARTYTIRNTGSATLALTGSPRVAITGTHAADFAVTIQPASTVAVGGSTTFAVTFDPTAEGIRDATVTFANSDADENPYTFAIRGTGSGAMPEMDVRGNNQVIANGDMAPSLSDYTDFGMAAVTGASVSRWFAIANTGNADLALTGTPPIVISGTHAADFRVSIGPRLPIAPAGSSSFMVVFDPTATGIRSATVSMANNDADENPYTFAIRGTGTDMPEIDVLGNRLSILDGDTTPSPTDHTEFGAVGVNGSTVTRTFTIANAGATLYLNDWPRVAVAGEHPDDFTVTSQPVSPVKPAASTTFSVTFDPVAGGQRRATLSIGSNDADENPYEFAIQGSAWSVSKLTAADGTEGDYFGSALAIDGDTAVIGASGVDIGTATNAGAAYILVRDGTNWTRQARLTDPEGTAFDAFGCAVAIDGDTVIIGANLADDQGDNSGAATVFVRQGTNWNRQARLTPGDGGLADNFGGAVAIRGDTVIVGAEGDDEKGFNAGAAYVFTRSGGVWAQQAKLTASDGRGDSSFGCAVAIDGLSAIIGAERDDDVASWAGAAYVFVRGGAVWTQQAKLTADDAEAGDSFGTAVDIAGDLAVVGAAFADGAGTSSGSAYVFERSGVTWTQRARLGDDAADGDYFGRAVAVDGDRVFVGANGERGVTYNTGAAHLFSREGGAWGRTTRFIAFDGAGWDYFSDAVAFDGDTLLIASSYDDDNGSSSGSVYTYGPVVGTAPELDVRGNGVSLIDADMTPSVDDGTDFGAVGVSSGQVTRVFSIRNIGTAPLALTGSPRAALSGEHAADFTVVTQPAAEVAPGEATELAVAFDPARSVVSTAILTIPNNDRNENPFTFAIRGTGIRYSCQSVLVAEDGASADWFGCAVSIDGTTAIVGAEQDDDNGSNSGSAHVYVRDGEDWRLQAKLLGDPDTVGAHFGYAVAVDGDTAIVGAPEDGSDTAAYIFVRQGETWTRQAKLTGYSFDFGQAVAIDGDTAVVGAPFVGGKAYVFVREGTNWPRRATLTPDGSGVYFGNAVAIEGDTLLVGMSGDGALGSQSGSVSVFARQGTAWIRQAQLLASDGEPNDHFGTTVALDGDTALVGASGDDDRASAAGAAYVFARAGTNWVQQAKLTAIDGVKNDLLGTGVGLLGETAVVGSLPAAYAFLRQGTNWTYMTRLAVGRDEDNIRAVAGSGVTALVGSRFDNYETANAGAVYWFDFRNPSATSPELDLRGNGVRIADGDATPDAGNHTDFGPVPIADGVVTHTFTIANIGDAALELTGAPRVAISGAHAGEFDVTVQPNSPVAPAGATDFTIAFDPAAAGPRSATVTILNGDADESPFDFAIRGTGTAAPEMDVTGDGNSIANGDDTPDASDLTDFGAAAVSDGNVSRTFTILNTGDAALLLTGAPRVMLQGTHASDFTVTEQPTSPVPAGSRTSFTVRFDPAASGTRTASVVIANDDGNENPYSFAIRGSGLTAPETVVEGNGHVIANGDDTPGTVDHTQFGACLVRGGTATHTFTIRNTGNATLTLTGIPPVSVSGAHTADFTIATPPATSVPANGTSTFSVRFDPSAAGARDATLSIANSDTDRNPYTFAVRGTGTTAPELDVAGNGVSIAAGDMAPSPLDHTDFGAVPVGGPPLERTFTIRNAGDGSLVLLGTPLVGLSGEHASDFRVTAQPAALVAPGGSTTFTVACLPAAEGTRRAIVSIASNDADENPHAFALAATAEAAATVLAFVDVACDPAFVTLTVRADDGLTYRLQRSTNLVDWLTLTNRSSGGALRIPRTAAVNACYYRLAAATNGAPVLLSLALDGGAAATADRDVTLNHTYEGIPQFYMASEYADFRDATWQPHSAAPVFTLSSGAGAKTVYVKLRNDLGKSAALSDSILLEEFFGADLTVNAAPITGELATPGDEDWYRFNAATEGPYTLDTWAGTLIDNHMWLYGPDSQTLLLDYNDDGNGLAARIVRELTPGTYYLKIRAFDASGTGTYTIRVAH